MIAALLPLIPLLAPLVPQIASWLGGDDAEDVARQVTGVVTAVAGSTDPTAVAAVMADPSRAGQLAADLARIAADREKAARDADIAEITARLQDMANARGQTVELAKVGHPMAYMPAIVTAGLFIVFGWTLERLFAGALSPSSREIALIVVGTVGAAFTQAVQYWLGSSSGSAAKDSRLGQITAATMHTPSEPTGVRPLVRR
jgi:hypothetical protein